MSEEHLQRKPHAIRGTKMAWWYEQANGICVVQQYREADVHIGTVTTLIPWNSIRSALARREKP